MFGNYNISKPTTHAISLGLRYTHPVILQCSLVMRLLVTETAVPAFMLVPPLLSSVFLTFPVNIAA